MSEARDGLEQFREIYGRVKTIAVVGASNNPTKPANSIPKYLKEEGFRIVPVNPMAPEILGERSYPSVTTAAEGAIDGDVAGHGSKAFEHLSDHDWYVHARGRSAGRGRSGW